MSRIGSVMMALAVGCMLSSSCSTTRKISQVGLREPASARSSTAISELRTRISTSTEPKKACPAEIRENFSALAAERVSFPLCPAGLAELVQSSVPYLTLEERSTMEEVVSSQCRSLGNSEFGEALENLIAGYDSTGPIGRRLKIVETLRPTDGETKILGDLRLAVQELVDHNLPLDRWVRRNGEFVLPDEELKQLARLIEDNGCKMSEQEVDHGYQTVRSLEELAKILKPGPQHARVDAFIGGVHKVIEQRIKEFFYP